MLWNVEKPGLFLNRESLQIALNTLTAGYKVDTIGIRGGEPSLHPELPTLIKMASNFAKKVFIETHGRWLNLVKPGSLSEHILTECRESGAVLKISFDSMHGISGDRLKHLLDTAEEYRVEWVIAITEETKAEALNISETAPWLSRENVIFQHKAKTSSGLVRPRLGTVTTEGKIQRQLTSKFENPKIPTEVLA